MRRPGRRPRSTNSSATELLCEGCAMNSYRNLASQKIADTLTTLAQRIGERFPGSGLLQVCRELIVMAEQTSEREDKIGRPNVPLIAGVWLLLLLAAGTIVWLLGKATQLEASTEQTNRM